MKSFKTILTGAIIAGLLLISANGAMAAYSGTYLSGGNSVNFGTTGQDVFSYDGSDQFSYTTSGMTWAADNGSNYFYGVGLDLSPYADVLGVSGMGGAFGFIKSTYAFGGTTANDISASVSTFTGSSLIAIQAFQASPGLAEWLYGGDLQSVLTGYAQDLLADLGAYDLTGANIGFGYFYDNDDKFDVSLGNLDETGLVALFNGADVDTYVKTATPIPGAIWLLGSGLVGLVGLRRRMRD